jgi:hypothetical protein
VSRGIENEAFRADPELVVAMDQVLILAIAAPPIERNQAVVRGEDLAVHSFAANDLNIIP